MPEALCHVNSKTPPTLPPFIGAINETINARMRLLPDDCPEIRCLLHLKNGLLHSRREALADARR